MREKLIKSLVDDAILIFKEELKQRADAYTTHLRYGGKGDPAEEVNLDALEMAISALEKTKWIPVTERLPDSQNPVLVVAVSKGMGLPYIFKAAHINHHEITEDEYGWTDGEYDSEYDEENDCFWIPECWYECNAVEGNTNWIMDDDYTITHWMPLPEPPKE